MSIFREFLAYKFDLSQIDEKNLADFFRKIKKDGGEKIFLENFKIEKKDGGNFLFFENGEISIAVGIGEKMDFKEIEKKYDELFQKYYKLGDEKVGFELAKIGIIFLAAVKNEEHFLILQRAFFGLMNNFLFYFVDKKSDDEIIFDENVEKIFAEFEKFLEKTKSEDEQFYDTAARFCDAKFRKNSNRENLEKAIKYYKKYFQFYKEENYEDVLENEDLYKILDLENGPRLAELEKIAAKKNLKN